MMRKETINKLQLCLHPSWTIFGACGLPNDEGVAVMFLKDDYYEWDAEPVTYYPLQFILKAIDELGYEWQLIRKKPYYSMLLTLSNDIKFSGSDETPEEAAAQAYLWAVAQKV